MKFFLTLAFLAVASVSHSAESVPDQYPGSPLYSKPVEFIPGVFTSTGATAPPTYENAGHNNNLSFIVTGDGVVVINGGASSQLAKALHDEIKQITDQPVKMVFNENGQGHAMLGNSYWSEIGVPTIAHTAAAAAFADRGPQSLAAQERVAKEQSEGTTIVEPTETFDDEYIVEMGDFRIEALYLGPAHSPGDITIWLPKQKLAIAGDIAFHERLLPIFEDTIALDWLETWDAAFEPLGALYVIPGHGHPTNMDQVRRYTKDYLVYLRGKVGEVIEAGGTLADSYYVDQSPYAKLHTFDELATKNAGRIYEQMEFE